MDGGDWGPLTLCALLTYGRRAHVPDAGPHLRAARDQGAVSPGAQGGHADLPAQPPAAGRRMGHAHRVRQVRLAFARPSVEVADLT